MKTIINYESARTNACMQEMIKNFARYAQHHSNKYYYNYQERRNKNSKKGQT